LLRHLFFFLLVLIFSGETVFLAEKLSSKKSIPSLVNAQKTSLLQSKNIPTSQITASAVKSLFGVNAPTKLLEVDNSHFFHYLTQKFQHILKIYVKQNTF